MTVARTRAIALSGLAGSVVEVEAHSGGGLPGMVLIGLPDAALSQARHRVRSAATRVGSPLSERHLVVNLSPASLPKHGSSFDLAIAMACLVAVGSIPAETIGDTAYLGELGLDGRVRPVPGVLPAVLSARRAGVGRVVVPRANAAEAGLVDGIAVRAVASLHEAAGIGDGPEPEPGAGEAADSRGLDGAGPDGPGEEASVPELSDVVGNAEAVEALLIAATGRHHLLMTGPPGVGKTMLATRLAALLPDLDDEEALEASGIRSLSGGSVAGGLLRRPPFEAPHHTASAAAMIGGGSGAIRPGAVVRASGGVLFLDEAPEFAPSVLDSLRQPLENGSVTVSRAQGSATFPARVLLVLAANPCPCGLFGVPGAECTCPPSVRMRYLGRLSGPLLDRVDIQVQVQRVASALREAGSVAPTTAEARGRVAEGRARALRRLEGTPWRAMSEVPGPWLRRTHPMAADASAPADRALSTGRISMRGYDRVIRLAYTIADLEGRAGPDRADVGRALFLRRGIPR